MSVCALALTVGSFVPTLANTQNAQPSATAGDQSSFEVTATGSYEVASAVTSPSTNAVDVATSAETAPAFGADFSMWNTATPTIATAPSVAAAAVAAHHAASATTPLASVGQENEPATISRLASGLFTRTRELASRITESAMHFIGTPYVFGGTSVYGFDCSGYVQHVFAMFGISLPRTADAQYMVGQHVAQQQMVKGDLVFFQTYTAGVSHVGIYLGNGSFIHSSSHGVEVSSLHEDYWASRYVGATHIIGANIVASHLVN